MGALEMGTWGGRAPVLPPVVVLVFLFPIPTSHYSSSHEGKEWDVVACTLLMAWFAVCRGGVGSVHHLSAAAVAAAGSVVVAAAAAAGSFVVATAI